MDDCSSSGEYTDDGYSSDSEGMSEWIDDDF